MDTLSEIFCINISGSDQFWLLRYIDLNISDFMFPEIPVTSIHRQNMAFSFKRLLIEVTKYLPFKAEKMFNFGTIYAIILLIIIRAEALAVAPLVGRGLVLDDFQADTLLNGTRLRILFNTHKKICALMCTLHPQCISINFCGRSTCQLNSKDIYFGNVSLVKATGCSYYGIRLDQAPICEEEGVAKLIANDRNPGWLKN